MVINFISSKNCIAIRNLGNKEKFKNSPIFHIILYSSNLELLV